MNEKLHRSYEMILEECRDDSNVIGFILYGSRGKGFTAEHSDFDFTIVVADGVVEDYITKYTDSLDGIDCDVCTLEDFRNSAEWGSEDQCYRYMWAHVEPQIDRTGGVIQQIINEKSFVPVEHVDKFINYSLDYYANQFYRSLKCLRIGNIIGHRLEAAEMVIPLLDAIFALHDRRLRPYYKYLEWELEMFPLEKLPWDKDALLDMVLSILETGDYHAQKKIFGGIEKLFRSEGYGEVFDGWGAHLIEMMEWTPDRIDE